MSYNLMRELALNYKLKGEETFRVALDLHYIPGTSKVRVCGLKGPYGILVSSQPTRDGGCHVIVEANTMEVYDFTTRELEKQYASEGKRSPCCKRPIKLKDKSIYCSRCNKVIGRYGNYS